jgi:hypothetical protein
MKFTNAKVDSWVLHPTVSKIDPGNLNEESCKMLKDKDDSLDGIQTRFLTTRWYSRLSRASVTHWGVNSCVIYVVLLKCKSLFVYWHKDVMALQSLCQGSGVLWLLRVTNLAIRLRRRPRCSFKLNPSILFLLKVPAADATDAPQPECLEDD